MGRKRHRARQAKTKGGALTSLRGGFRGAVRGVTGTGPARPASRTRTIVSNVITVALLLVAVALLLRRFGVLHR